VLLSREGGAQLGQCPTLSPSFGFRSPAAGQQIYQLLGCRATEARVTGQDALVLVPMRNPAILN